MCIKLFCDILILSLHLKVDGIGLDDWVTESHQCLKSLSWRSVVLEVRDFFPLLLREA